jgi:hypothetical protein
MRGVGPFVVTEKARTLRVRGRGSGDFLRGYGLRPMYVRNAWVIDSSHASDLAAWCDYQNVRYRWEPET